jgi:hypothetical protein
MADDGSTPDDTEFELDAADLYCMGGTGDHQFIASVFADSQENFAGEHIDHIGVDIIV